VPGTLTVSGVTAYEQACSPAAATPTSANATTTIMPITVRHMTAVAQQPCRTVTAATPRARRCAVAELHIAAPRSGVAIAEM
jgi:hypothetical protein